MTTHITSIAIGDPIKTLAASQSTSQDPTSTPSSPIASKQSKGNMVQVKIRSFRGRRDGKEDPQEYIEDIEWACDQENDTGPGNVVGKAHRLLFRQKVYLADQVLWMSGAC